MKFGKQLAKTVALSDAEWAPFWISYKALKKRIKELQSRQAAVSVMALASASAPSSADEGGGGGGGGGAAGGGKCDSSSASGGSGGGRAPTPKDLARSVGEVAFFKTIRAEISKATEFYLGMEQQMGARKRRIRLGIQYLKQPTTVLEDDAWTRMRGACVALYKDLLLLEHFAVMNYCACAKALKKHDKTVGLDVRARFMRNVVHQQPFTHYPRLLEMLQEVEVTFQEINAVQGESSRPLEAEERLFLEAIRGLNQQASHMQREEKADMGHLSAASDSSDCDQQQQQQQQQHAAADAKGEDGGGGAVAALASPAVPGGGGGGGEGDLALKRRRV